MVTCGVGMKTGLHTVTAGVDSVGVVVSPVHGRHQ